MGERPGQPKVVEHYRLDPSRRVRRALGWGASIVTLGGVVMAAAIVLPRFDPDRPVHARAMRASDAMFRGPAVGPDGEPLEHGTLALELVLVATGLGCIVSGASIAIVGLRGVLSEERYLLLRTDGALFRTEAESSFVSWDDVEDVRWDAGSHTVRFVRHDGTAWLRGERFAGIAGDELAGRAKEIRRKALFGMLFRGG